MARLMTYADIAAEFSINRRSAEQLVRRKRWLRRKGNDGRARIEVPDDALPAFLEAPSEALSVAPSESSSDTPSVAPSDTPSDGARDLLRHLVERLESEVAELRPKAAERDAAVARAEALQGLLETERQRVEEWKAVADRWAQQIEQMIQALPAPTPPRRRWWWRWAG
jgi:hypothetical protein